MRKVARFVWLYLPSSRYVLCRCSVQASPEILGEHSDVGFLKHAQVIPGNDFDLKPFGGQLSPAVVAIVRRNERLHPSPKETEATRINLRPVCTQGRVVRQSDLPVLLGKLEEITHLFYVLRTRVLVKPHT